MSLKRATLAITVPLLLAVPASALVTTDPAMAYPSGVTVTTTGSGWAHTLPGIARHVCHKSTPAIWRQIKEDNQITVAGNSLPPGEKILVTYKACRASAPPIPRRPR